MAGLLLLDGQHSLAVIQLNMFPPLPSESKDLPTVTRGKCGKYDRALPNIAAAAMMIPELKHLYVGITRARFGCAFVESGQVWQELANNWSAAGLVTLMKDSVRASACVRGVFLCASGLNLCLCVCISALGADNVGACPPKT